MKIGTSKLAVATFGAALTSLYSAPELNGNIVTLTFSPGSVGWSVGQVSVGLDQPGVSFSQWNDSIGKTLSIGGLASVGTLPYSALIDPGTFVGSAGLVFTASATGTTFIGFRTLGGNVGWFSMNLGGFGNSITFLTGEFGDAGETLRVGGTAIPEPAATGIAALAMGAVALRRRRK